MRYVKPHYYDAFRCVADNCSDTCCAGWQIVIDEEKLEEYSQVKGPFGNRLYASIDWREGIFRQKKGRCSFLNHENLCDIYRELGKDALCRTCAMYPRHVEEYEGLRELSLSLSCPVAAKMLLSLREPLTLTEYETDEEEELAEEFEDFDLLLFTQLEDARALLFSVLQDRQVNVEVRIQYVMKVAAQLQDCIDEERFFDVDEVISRCRKAWEAGALWTSADKNSSGHKEDSDRYHQMSEEYRVLEGLERLREEWSGVLCEAQEVLYRHGQETYDEICREFDANFGGDSKFREEWSLFTENLMLFFVYTYFCGAVYDNMIYSKAALGEFCVRWIRELVMARRIADIREKEVAGEAGEENPGFDWQLCIDTAYRFAREIENSDCNLNWLEEWLDDTGHGGSACEDRI